MRRQPLGCSHLVVPGKTTSAVGSKLHIIRRICVDKITGPNGERFEVAIDERPVSESSLVLGEVRRVRDRLVGSEGHIKLAGLVEAAEAVEARPVEVIEKLGGFGSLPVTSRNQFIEAATMFVKDSFRVPHRNGQLQTALKVQVKIQQVWINVTQ